VPNAPTGVSHDPDRHGRSAAWTVLVRRAVWTGWVLTMFGAAIAYGHKAATERSAFIRWRHQILELGQGVNIWDRYYFPTPPILPLTLYPLMALPPIAGALAWFGIKVVLASVSAILLFRMARIPGRPYLAWAQGLVLVLSLRPILSDLHHGNINLLILFLIVLALEAWRRGFDVLAGLVMALAISYKVTPALFIPYFLYKRSWRTVGAMMLGIGFFLVVAPSLILGPEFNWQCLTMWRLRILSPFLEHDVGSPQEVNQSMVGVLIRLLTEAKSAGRHGYNGTQLQQLHLNILDWGPPHVVWLAKGLSFGLLGLLAYFCRTRTQRRDDPRLLGEFSLVVLTMLFASERSWKHHFVTLLLPYAYLVYQVIVAPNRRVRGTILGALGLSAVLIALTSTEIGGPLVHDDAGEPIGHLIAQFYGLFFWASVVLYAATAWRVRADWQGITALRSDVPAPHLGSSASKTVAS
jgi:alpha-1,2-mannosyltransferase